MRDVIIKCGKGEVKKTLAYIEKKDRKVKWATGDKPTGWGSLFERIGVYLIIECDVLTFIELEEFEDSDKKGKDVVSAKEFLGKGKNPSIVIFRRDREVIAKNTATGNEGIAKCSPNDDFCFKTGASIALARLMAKTPEVLNHDVKDEWIKVLDLTPVKKKVYTDADRDFKVGDRVVVRDWDDMASEYPVKDGYIVKDSTISCFSKYMKRLCGRTATVTAIGENGGMGVKFDNESGGTNWVYKTWMFNPIDSGKPTPKFKVSDLVTLKSDAKSGEMYDGVILIDAMIEKLKGKSSVVTKVAVKDDYIDYTLGNGYIYSESMLEKCDESKIYEGDKVRIKKGCTGNRFDLYYKWVKEHISDPDLLLAFERGDHIDTSLDYEVVKIAPHEAQPRTLAYIKYKDDCLTLCYLFNIEALEKV